MKDFKDYFEAYFRDGDSRLKRAKNSSRSRYPSLYSSFGKTERERMENEFDRIKDQEDYEYTLKKREEEKKRIEDEISYLKNVVYKRVIQKDKREKKIDSMIAKGDKKEESLQKYYEKEERNIEAKLEEVAKIIMPQVAVSYFGNHELSNTLKNKMTVDIPVVFKTDLAKLGISSKKIDASGSKTVSKAKTKKEVDQEAYIKVKELFDDNDSPFGTIGKMVADKFKSKYFTLEFVDVSYDRKYSREKDFWILDSSWSSTKNKNLLELNFRTHLVLRIVPTQNWKDQLQK